MSVSLRRRSHRRLPLLAALLLSVLFTVPAASQNTPTSDQEVLFIGNLNGDHLADTVKGSIYGNARTYLPELIFWGRDTTSPTGGGGGGSVAVTQFIYPVYPEFAGSASFLKLNTNDTLTDIALFLWGRVDTSSVEPDTGRVLVIFGQTALDTMAVLTIEQISAFQSSPYFAQDIVVGVDLVDPAVRDLTETESYLLNPLDVAVDTSGSPPKPIITHVHDSVEVRIYPNPSLYTATLEAELPRGAYTARVVGVNGQIYEEQQLVLAEEGTLWRTLDVGRIAGGYYVVQLLRDGSVVGVYPFIIKR